MASSRFMRLTAAGVVTASTAALFLTAPPAWSDTGARAAIRTVAHAAARGCPKPDTGDPWSIYKFGRVSTKWKATNLKSDWLKGPGTITYNRTRTATLGGAVTGGLGAEAGIIFAKASAKIDITVNGSWAWSHTWSYQLQVKNHKIARMVMYHQTRKFGVKKYSWYPPICGYRYNKAGTVEAPRKSKTANVWRLQYQ